MNEEKERPRALVGFASRRHGLPSLDEQTSGFRREGCEDNNVWVRGRGDESLGKCINSLQRGDVLLVNRLVALAPPRKTGETWPKTAMNEAIDLLFDVGVEVRETSTGRTCKKSRDLALMQRDAYDMLAGHGKRHDNPGRPPKPAPTQAEIDTAKAIWFDHKNYRTNYDALAALRDLGWSRARVIEYLGGSGREPGRPKDRK